MDGFIVCDPMQIDIEALTHGSADAAKTALDLIDSIQGDIESLTADGAL